MKRGLIKDLSILLALIGLVILLISGNTVQTVDEFYAPATGAKTALPSADGAGTGVPSTRPGDPVDPDDPDDPDDSGDPSDPGEPEPEPETSPSVILSIRCDTVLDHYGDLDPTLQSDEFVPPDGVILPPTKYSITPGESVFDVLTRAVRENRIQMEYQGADVSVFGSVYVQGLHYLYEFSCGPLSGWMYRVDGVFPNYGCSEYRLHDGQVIEWVYTCDLGQDVGCEWLEGSGAGR